MHLYAKTGHQVLKGAYNLHGILRSREDAVIGLRYKADALTFKPAHRILVTEGLKSPSHEPEAPGIDFFERLHMGEAVGKIAASSPCNGHLRKRTRTSLQKDYIGRWFPPFQLYCRKTPGSASSYDCNPHILKSIPPILS